MTQVPVFLLSVGKTVLEGYGNSWVASLLGFLPYTDNLASCERFVLIVIPVYHVRHKLSEQITLTDRANEFSEVIGPIFKLVSGTKAVDLVALAVFYDYGLRLVKIGAGCVELVFGVREGAFFNYIAI
jgi:hypothetical protein